MRSEAVSDSVPLMELLDLLENRVAGLMAEVDRLRAENSRLREDVVAAESLLATSEEEKRALKESLTQEQQVKDAVLQRIDGLLQRLKDYGSDG